MAAGAVLMHASLISQLNVKHTLNALQPVTRMSQSTQLLLLWAALNHVSEGAFGSGDQTNSGLKENF